MSYASNLGYGNHSPFLSSSHINASNSHDPAAFTSRKIPDHGIFGVTSNIAAAMKGGRKKNIFFEKNKKKMAFSRKKRHLSSKRKTCACRRCRRLRRSGTRRLRHMRGGNGYHQYQSNVANTPSYATAGSFLSPVNLKLANPVPYTKHNNCTDTYNHFNKSSSNNWW